MKRKLTLLESGEIYHRKCIIFCSDLPRSTQWWLLYVLHGCVTSMPTAGLLELTDTFLGEATLSKMFDPPISVDA